MSRKGITSTITQTKVFPVGAKDPDVKWDLFREAARWEQPTADAQALINDLTREAMYTGTRIISATIARRMDPAAAIIVTFVGERD